MSEALDRLAEAYGIEPSYVSEGGETCFASDETKRRILRAMGVRAENDSEVAESLASAPQPLCDGSKAPIDMRCFMPDWLASGRVWGITCQLYGLRSQRNLGIGDFDDLAQLAELAGQAGADFLGINPLHALFYTDATRCSPYAPSSRLFLNPFYIAADRLPGGRSVLDPVAVESTRSTELLDYESMAQLKRRAFEAAYEDFCSAGRHGGSGADARSFESFCDERGRALQQFALYEALSEAMVARDYGASWRSWPADYQDLDSDLVERFAHDNPARIKFHMWLQWLAESQLMQAQSRAKAAGMRIGLYLDLAVGVAPDGADTWTQPDTLVEDARVGSPPDMFNPDGQDWGLAPLSPTALLARNFEPFEAMLRELMRSAGAVRIDHAMGLKRLYWIANDCPVADGAYVRFPMRETLSRLALISQESATIVIGEDLGTVPAGFRETMTEMEIQGYRVLYFEREPGGAFRPPKAYCRQALACLSTHDLPTLRGWWQGSDIDEREACGLISRAHAAKMRTGRSRDRKLLISALRSADLLPRSMEPASSGASSCPNDLPDDLCIAAHALLAKASSRLVAVQLEDMVGMQKQANMPGTVDEHPNWRRKLPIDLTDLPKATLFRGVARVLTNERSRQP